MSEEDLELINFDDDTNEQIELIKANELTIQEAEIIKPKKGLSKKTKKQKDKLLKELKEEYPDMALSTTDKPVEKAKEKDVDAEVVKISKSKLTNNMAELIIAYYDILVLYAYTGSPARYYMRRTMQGEELPYYISVDEAHLKITIDYFMSKRKDIHHIDNIDSYLDDQLVAKTTNFITTHAAVKATGITANNNVVHIAPVLNAEGESRNGLQMYWSRKDGLITATPDEVSQGEPGKCFSHFCDTNSSQSGVIKFQDGLDGDIVLQYMKQAAEDFREYEEEMENYRKYTDKEKEKKQKPHYPERFGSTFGVWADGNNDLYTDLLKLSALPLLEKKPPKIFFLLGRGASGKSTYRHLLQTIYGTENCAIVGTSKFADWSYTNTLIGKMLNIPDEDADTDFIEAPEFKSIASHDTVAFKRKGATIPMSIHCDFVNIMPMNTIPEWKNMDSGVTRRICIIPFYASLLSYDRKTKSFEEETFTKDLISQIIGEILGIASYYIETKKEVVFSDTVNLINSNYNEEHNSAEGFRKVFEQWFDSFTSYSLLYDVYAGWCKAHEYRISSLSTFKVAFNQYQRGKVSLAGKRANGYLRRDVAGKTRWNPFGEGTSIIDSTHPNGVSVSHLLEIGVNPILDMESYDEELQEALYKNGGQDGLL